MGLYSVPEVKIVDSTNRQSFNSVFGYNISDSRTSHILVQFQYNINSIDITDASVNDGTITQSDAMAVFTTSTTSNGRAIGTSVRHLRYLPGHEGYGIFTALFQNKGVADSTQFTGIFNSDDGYYLGFDGVDFVVGFRRGGTDTTTTQADFNINKIYTMVINFLSTFLK